VAFFFEAIDSNQVPMWAIFGHSPIGGVEPVAKRNFSEFVRVPGVPS
jgi:hypothetical protein